MDNFKRQEDIEDYLNGAMNDEQRQAFELEISTDAVLAADVEMYRELNDFIGNDEEAAYKNKISALGNEFFDVPEDNAIPKKRKNIWWFLALAVVILMILVVWLSGVLNPNSSNPSPEIIPTDTIQTQLPTKEPIDTLDNLPIPEEEKQPQSPTENQPIAAIDPSSLTPNPFFEDIISDISRDAQISIKNVFPTDGHTFKLNNQEVNILLYGEVISDGSLGEDDWELFIYSNQTEDFEQDRFIIRDVFKLKKENNNYRFRFNGIIDLERGLYYFYLKKVKSRKVYYVGKFLVH